MVLLTKIGEFCRKLGAFGAKIGEEKTRKFPWCPGDPDLTPEQSRHYHTFPIYSSTNTMQVCLVAPGNVGEEEAFLVGALRVGWCCWALVGGRLAPSSTLR